MEAGAVVVLGLGAVALLFLWKQQQAEAVQFTAAIAKKKSGAASANDYVQTGALIASLL